MEDIFGGWYSADQKRFDDMWKDLEDHNPIYDRDYERPARDTLEHRSPNDVAPWKAGEYSDEF